MVDSVALNELSGIRLSLKSAKAIHWLTAAELFEVGEIEGARAVIKSSPVLQSLKMSSPSEFLALESLGALKSFDEAVAYHGGSKQDARNDAARLIEDEVKINNFFIFFIIFSNQTTLTHRCLDRRAGAF